MYNIYWYRIFLSPTLNIIQPKFHIVQLLTRELNKLRINEMRKLNTRSKEYKILKRYWKIPLRKSIKSLKKLRKYVVNSLKYDYTNAMVESKNNKIKVIKRVPYGYRSFRNFKARIMLIERYKIQKGSIHSYKFAMDAAA